MLGDIGIIIIVNLLHELGCAVAHKFYNYYNYHLKNLCIHNNIKKNAKL